MRKREISLLLVAVVIVQIIILSFINPVTKEKDEPEKKVHILILSTWRSGASLIGQFFSQHPDVFYLKEPAWHVWKSLPYNTIEVLHMVVRDMLRLLFRCDMSVFEAYIESHVSDIFHWAASRALCSPPACNAFSRESIVHENGCRTICSKIPFIKVEESCKTYSHVVLQEVRIFDLKVLYSLLTDDTLNLKILHVVRDPRAVAYSREKVHTALNFDNSIILNSENTNITNDDMKILKAICQSQADIYREIHFQPPSFLKDRYMLLRYDDVVIDPLRTAQQMFAFAGLELTEKLKTWIHKITHGPRQQKSNPFTVTQLDALYVSQAWRKRMSFKKVKLVQKICKYTMEVFRYQNIDSEEELKDFSVKTVLPRQEDFIWEHNTDMDWGE